MFQTSKVTYSMPLPLASFWLLFPVPAMSLVRPLCLRKRTLYNMAALRSVPVPESAAPAEAAP